MSLPSYPNPDYSEFVEVDPTGRYGRSNEVVGRGATKIVYRGFDKHEGIEVAWNQVVLYHYLESHGNLEWLFDEVHLLKTLNHQNIMKFFTIWVDNVNKNINFVTEMFNSSLRQYRLKHRRVSIRTVKNWCRQILKGLVYLHSHDPPVIHGNLNGDNIFINGNEGTVKIGELGLVEILTGESHAVRSLGRPEFMAPEVYEEEEYNELVDVYSFGMCVLEMVTSEYPYSECSDNTEIWKKVISGDTPDALYKVYPDIREFVKKCLAPVSLRLSPTELLNDPFLQIDDSELDLRLLDHPIDFIDRQLRLGSSGNESFEYQLYEDYENSKNVDMSIKGKRRDDGSILVRLQVIDRKGRIQKIYFPFDVKIDSTVDVATEMVTDFDSYEQDLTKISNMIDAEISALIPEWTPRQAKYLQRQLHQLENQNEYDETFNVVDPKPSQYNFMAQQKPSDSATNNPLGCRASVQPVPAKKHALERVPSLLGNNPSICDGVPTEAPSSTSQSIPAREPVIDHVSFYSGSKPTIHLGVPSKATTTNLQPQAVAPRTSIRSRYFRKWKQKFLL